MLTIALNARAVAAILAFAVLAELALYAVVAVAIFAWYAVATLAGTLRSGHVAFAFLTMRAVCAFFAAAIFFTVFAVAARAGTF